MLLKILSHLSYLHGELGVLLVGGVGGEVVGLEAGDDLNYILNVYYTFNHILLLLLVVMTSSVL